MQDQRLLGSWRLVSWTLTDEQGQVRFPFGENAKGFLSYMEDGRMSVHLAHETRPPIASENILDISADEAQAHYAKQASYCGQFSVEDGRVIHHIDCCSYSNWEGEDRIRAYQIEGDQLQLTHDLYGDQSCLIWERIKPGQV